MNTTGNYRELPTITGMGVTICGIVEAIEEDVVVDVDRRGPPATNRRDVVPVRR
jgi:hypothetical protein